VCLIVAKFAVLTLIIMANDIEVILGALVKRGRNYTRGYYR